MPLMLAAEEGHLAMVKALVGKGVDLNAEHYIAGVGGRGTALTQAINGKQKECALCLITETPRCKAGISTSFLRLPADRRSVQGDADGGEGAGAEGGGCTCIV